MKLSLRWKVLIPVLLATGLMLGTSLYGFSETYKKLLAMSEASHVSIVRNRQIAGIERSFGVMIQDWKNTLLRGSNPESFKKHAAGMDESIKKQLALADEILKGLDGTEKEQLSLFVENLRNLETKYKEARTKFLEGGTFSPAEADQAVKGIDRKALDPLTALIQTSNEKFEAAQAASTQEFKQSIQQATFWLCGVVAAALILIGLIIGRTTGYINRLTQRLLNVAGEVHTSSADLETASASLSHATTEQAASLEETATSLEEITAMGAKSADGALATETRSTDSLKKAGEGRHAVEEMLNSMRQISASNDAILEQVQNSNREMTEIVRVIQEIGNKTKVINEIVFQTKLLSFNASVEAARAGEHGKGFAVVAQEVGNLAQMSGNAAKEITEMLDTNIVRVEKIVAEMKSRVEVLSAEGKKKVDSGVQLAEECSTLLSEIVENISQVAGLAKEISSASKEQAQGLGEISSAVTQLDTATQQNAATSEKSAQVAENLSQQAHILKQSVDELMDAVGGRWGRKPEVPAPVARETEDPQEQAA